MAAQPRIAVPSITLDGADDGVMLIGGTSRHAVHFTGSHEHRVVASAGHNLEEAPQTFTQAVRDLLSMS